MTPFERIERELLVFREIELVLLAPALQGDELALDNLARVMVRIEDREWDSFRLAHECEDR